MACKFREADFLFQESNTTHTLVPRFNAYRYKARSVYDAELLWLPIFNEFMLKFHAQILWQKFYISWVLPCCLHKCFARACAEMKHPIIDGHQKNTVYAGAIWVEELCFHYSLQIKLAFRFERAAHFHFPKNSTVSCTMPSLDFSSRTLKCWIWGWNSGLISTWRPPLLLCLKSIESDRSTQ